MALTLAQQASQAATQGQQLLSSDEANQKTASDQYNTDTSEATSANQQEQAEASYMQGAGSGSNVYDSQLAQQEQAGGYNPQQLSDANSTLFGLTGAMNSANSQFNTAGGVGAYGVSAPALASYESSILNPLQTGVNTANTEVGTLNSELGTFETGANQATTSQVQSEQNTVTALNNAVVNYQAQASVAQQNMQEYATLAQQQGGLNATEQQGYAAAQQALATAQQAIAQSKLFIAQTTGQNLTNQQTTNYMNSPAYQTALGKGTSSNSGGLTVSSGSGLQPTLSAGSLQGGSGGSVLQGAIGAGQLQ